MTLLDLPDEISGTRSTWNVSPPYRLEIADLKHRFALHLPFAFTRCASRAPRENGTFDLRETARIQLLVECYVR